MVHFKNRTPSNRQNRITWGIGENRTANRTPKPNDKRAWLIFLITVTDDCNSKTALLLVRSTQESTHQTAFLWVRKTQHPAKDKASHIKPCAYSATANATDKSQNATGKNYCKILLLNLIYNGKFTVRINQRLTNDNRWQSVDIYFWLLKNTNFY